MRVYLAGKIGRNDWRHDFVAHLHSAYSDADYADGAPWPILKDALGPGLDYVGPFFVRCDHRCAHSRGHAFNSACSNNEFGSATAAHRGSPVHGSEGSVAVDMCMRAIEDCDVVIALIAPDAHGTLVEVGYAHALGKQIALVDDPSNLRKSDYGNDEESDIRGGREAWFPFDLCGAQTYPAVADAVVHFRFEAGRCALREKCESPIELAFWDAMFPYRLPFTPQVQVGKYRIDFADATRKIGIELDGHQWHSGKDQFTKDRQRQRDLEMQGWRIIRFAGSEVHADAAACVRQLIKWIKALP